jgi:Phage integrase, N-terminal SAM-like domain
MTMGARLSARYRWGPDPAGGRERTGTAWRSPPRFLDRVREAARAQHYSGRTEKTYAAWVRRYIGLHGKSHPIEMGAPEVTPVPDLPFVR